MAEIGKRIRTKREELGMTQEELASKLGYKSKTTIAKIENGTNDIVQSKVIAFAKALGTTPAYLMGWSKETIETKYNTLSSCDSEALNRYADFLYMRERQLITTDIADEYMEFIIAEKTYDLNKLGKREALKRVTELTEINRYATDLSISEEIRAAHERTDIKATDEMKKHDDDIMNDDSEWE